MPFKNSLNYFNLNLNNGILAIWTPGYEKV